MPDAYEICEKIVNWVARMYPWDESWSCIFGCGGSAPHHRPGCPHLLANQLLTDLTLRIGEHERCDVESLGA